MNEDSQMDGPVTPAMTVAELSSVLDAARANQKEATERLAIARSTEKTAAIAEKAAYKAFRAAVKAMSPARKPKAAPKPKPT